MCILNVLVPDRSLGTVPSLSQVTQWTICLSTPKRQEFWLLFVVFFPLAGILGNLKQFKYQLTYVPLTLSWKCQTFILSTLMNNYQLF